MAATTSRVRLTAAPLSRPLAASSQARPAQAAASSIAPALYASLFIARVCRASRPAAVAYFSAPADSAARASRLRVAARYTARSRQRSTAAPSRACS